MPVASASHRYGYRFSVKPGYAEVAQLVEHLSSKQRVAGPSPVFRSYMPGDPRLHRRAGSSFCSSVVEQFTVNEKVAGSIPAGSAYYWWMVLMVARLTVNQ